MINIKHEFVILSKNIARDDLKLELSDLYKLEDGGPDRVVKPARGEMKC
jgi:hypothetical protein